MCTVSQVRVFTMSRDILTCSWVADDTRICDTGQDAVQQALGLHASIQTHLPLDLLVISDLWG